MIFRRAFGDVARRQLDLFEEENAELLAAVEEAERAYDRAPRDEAEERYGDLVDLVDAAAEELAGLRDAYARTLDGDAVERYEAAFSRAVARRFKRLAPELEEL